MLKSSTLAVMVAALALAGCEHTAETTGGGARPKRPAVTQQRPHVRPAAPPVVIQPEPGKPASAPPVASGKPTWAECEERVKGVKFWTILGDQSRVKIRRNRWINRCVAGKV